MPLIAAQPKQPAGAQNPQSNQSTQAFDQLHPRGRGGKWILKPGSGTVPGQPDETTAQLQQRLQQLGFKIPVNGQYDAATQSAVSQFQARYGLDPHGGIDAATLEVLQNPPSETLAQTQKAQGLNPQGKKITTSAKKASSASSKSKTSASTGKSTGSAQTASQKATAASKLTVQSLGGGTGTLKSGTGMTGGANAQVRSLQTDLGNVGYKVTVDGQFGPQTEAAVKKLQAEHGLKATGQVDPATKGLLAGLAAGSASKTTASTTSKSQSAALKAATTAAAKSAAAAQIAANPAQRQTKVGKASKSSKTMKLTQPKAGKATLKYHDDDQPTEPPDLEETVTELREDTLVNGTGTQPSMAIPDSRDAIPESDKPIWTSTGWRELPDYTIQDSRGGSGELPEGAPDVMIPDSRNTVGVDLLEQAIAERKAATNGRDFTRARAREQVIRRWLAEGLWSEALHPRGRGGKFANVLNKLTGKSGKPKDDHFVTRSGKEYRIRAPKPPGGSMGFAPGAELKPGEKDPRIWSSTWGTPMPGEGSHHEGFSHPAAPRIRAAAASPPAPPKTPKIKAPAAQPEPLGHDKYGVALKKGSRVLLPKPYGGNKEGFVTGKHESGAINVSPGTFPGVTLQHPAGDLEDIPGAGQRWTVSSRPVSKK